MKKSFTSVLEKMDSNVWGLIFRIPKEISDYFVENEIKRYEVILNHNKKIYRGMLPMGKQRYYLYFNQELQKSLSLQLGEEVHISMEADTSEYGMPLPDELEEGFALMEVANELFHKLTPGKQRTLIYMVAKPKRAETRAKKAIDILEYLEVVDGKLDFKELNEWFKSRKDVRR